MDDSTFHKPSWLSNPSTAFAAFVRSPAFTDTAYKPRAVERLSAASVTVYESMFSRFVGYLTRCQRTLDTVGPDDIYAFLTLTNEGRLVLGSGIQSRYQRLLERVFAHIGREPNPMTSLVFGPMAEMYRLEGRNKKTVVLTHDQIDRFLAALPVSTTQERTNRQSAAWKKKRDRALQCMILGAGLKVAEAIALRIDEVDRTPELDGSLRVKLQVAGTAGIDAKQPTFSPHMTFVQPAFVIEIQDWLAQRARLPGLGALMFPTHKGTMLKKGSVYLQIRNTFGRAGISVPREGGRTLRNTFAITELENDTDLAELSDKLGLLEDRSILVYTNAKQLATTE